MLGWAGAVAVLLGVAFLVAVAIGRGWIDEPARIALAFAGSAALLAAGAWLHERRGGTQASLAIAGSGLAGLFLALTAGAQLYHLYPAPIALAEAFLIGFVGTVLAVRWNTRTIAALAIGGALLSPVLVGADLTNLVMALLLVAFACAVAILVDRRWSWLAVGCFTITAPQLLAWVYGEPRPALLIAGLAAFLLVNAAAAFGHALRTSEHDLDPSSVLLVLGGAIVAAAAGYFGLQETGSDAFADWWLAALAAAHLGAGALALRTARVADAIGVVTVGAGIVLADLAFGAFASGPVLVAGWAASAVALTLLAGAQRERGRSALFAAAGQLTLAMAHALLFDASPDAIVHAGDHLATALVGIGCVGVTCFTCARVLSEREPRLALGLDTVVLASIAYAEAHAFHGPPLVAALAGTAVAVAGVIKREQLALGAAGSFLVLAAVPALGVEAPPVPALTFGVDDFVGAATALAAVGAGCFATARLLAGRVSQVAHTALQAAGCVAILYLASTAIVTAFQPSADSLGAGLALGVRQQGQVLLSGLWAAVGAVALLSGLRRDRIELRVAGFGLLGLAFGKVILFDLSTLDSIYRVASCVALGLLLLGSAFAYQRLRPRMPASR